MAINTNLSISMSFCIEIRSKSIRFSRVTKKRMFKISICQDFTTSTPNPDSALEGYKTYPGPGHRKKVRHVSDV